MIDVPSAPQALYGANGPRNDLGNGILRKVAQADDNPYAGAAARLYKKVQNDEPFTPEDLANSIRDPVPVSPGDAVQIGRVDPNHPVVRELLKNLPPDIGYSPNHGGGGPTLFLKKDKSDVPMS